jgi:hypothetical protein
MNARDHHVQLGVLRLQLSVSRFEFGDPIPKPHKFFYRAARDKCWIFTLSARST